MESQLDGRVYFGSLSEDNGPPAIDAASYEGPRWFRVSIETGRVEPRGRINAFWGLLGQVMDKKRTGRVEAVGLLRAADGRYAYASQGAKTDADGRVWFVGAFEEPDPERAVNPGAASPYSMGLGCYDPRPAR